MSEAANFPRAPLVSVILPVYNAADFLEETLNGILGQTLRDLELICVDDGSRDDSFRILTEHAEGDSRMRVLRQENAGAGAARNAGLALASGRYLAFLDADDRFEPDLLSTAVAHLERTGADICCYAADSFDAVTGAVSTYRVALDPRYLPAENPFHPMDPGPREKVLQMFNGVPWSKVFRRGFIAETGLTFQPQRTTNDAFFVYSALCRAKSIVTEPRVLVHRRKNVASGLTQTRDKSSLCFYDALTAIRDRLAADGLLPAFDRTFANRALQNMIWNLETLSPAAGAEIYPRMREEGIPRLGLEGHPREYFYDKANYDKLQLMREQGDFSAWRKACQELEKSKQKSASEQPIPQPTSKVRSLLSRVAKKLGK